LSGASAWDPDRTYFFIHVMKTGGSSLLRHITDNFPDGGSEPDVAAKVRDGGERVRPTYGSLDRLRSLSEERRRSIRIYAGHYPFFVTGLVPTDITMTVLRDPLERTLSFLRHCRRYDPTKRDLSLEEIYDGPWDFPLLIHNYQAKLFSLEPTDTFPDRAHLAHVRVDDRRVATAIDNLASVDLVGLHHRFEEFLAALSQQYGWTFAASYRQRATTEDWPASTALRERIEHDNQADRAFFDAAVALYDARRRRSP